MLSKLKVALMSWLIRRRLLALRCENCGADVYVEEESDGDDERTEIGADKRD